MSVFGIGIHVLIALFFAIHVVRTGREMYWLFVLFMFPGLGSIVYFFAIYLPQSRLDRGLRQAGSALQRGLDPGRELREAQRAFDLTPTAHNQMRLAAALQGAGKADEAVAQYDACLRGPFARDPEICLGAARAKLANAQAPEALALLQTLRRESPNFRPEQVGLALAQAFQAGGMVAEAGAELADVVARFASMEARAEYAIWAVGVGRFDIARQQFDEIDHSRKHMAGHTRDLHQALFRRVDAAKAQMPR